MIEESGAQIIGYDTIDEIGQSVYAITYLARQQSPDRIVSLKILRASEFDPDEIRQLFYNAAKIVKLEHTNIASVYDIAVSKNQHYIASEYIPGQSLKHRAKAGFAPDQILALTRTLVEALCYAHKKGVAHQNIKLENILMRQDGTLVLTDFGLGVGLKKNLAFFNANLVNTLDNVKIQWDTYSVGTCLYELITGKVYNRPINGVSETELPEDTRFLHPLLNRILDLNNEAYIGNMQLLKAELKNLLEAIPTLGSSSKSKRIETKPKPKPKVQPQRLTPEPVGDGVKPLDNQVSLMELIQYSFDSIKDKFANNRNKKVKVEPPILARQNPRIESQFNTVEPRLEASATQSRQVYSQNRLPVPVRTAPAPALRDESWINNESLVKKIIIGVTTVIAVSVLLYTMPNSKDSTSLTKSDSTKVSKTRSVSVAPKPVPKVNSNEFDKLFKEAEQLWAKNYLTKPKNENAYDIYLKILEQEANNQRAREGIARIANYFEQRAQRKKGVGRLESSLADVLSGLKIQPNHAGLIILKSELLTRIEEKKRRENQTQQIAQPQASAPPPADENSAVTKLLNKAEQQWRQKKLVSPPGDNAYETYLKALELDASNKRAALGLKRMAIYFEGRAESSLEDDAIQESLNFIEQALRITPENERLRIFRNELKQKVAEGDPQPLPEEKKPNSEQVNIIGNF